MAIDTAREMASRQDADKMRQPGYSTVQQSLEARGKIPEAKEVTQRFAKAWQHADLKLTASHL